MSSTFRAGSGNVILKNITVDKIAHTVVTLTLAKQNSNQQNFPSFLLLHNYPKLHSAVSTSENAKVQPVIIIIQEHPNCCCHCRWDFFGGKHWNPLTALRDPHLHLQFRLTLDQLFLLLLLLLFHFYFAVGVDKDEKIALSHFGPPPPPPPLCTLQLTVNSPLSFSFQLWGFLFSILIFKLGDTKGANLAGAKLGRGVFLIKEALLLEASKKHRPFASCWKR